MPVSLPVRAHRPPPPQCCASFHSRAFAYLCPPTVVLECIPDRVATFITQQLRVPTIGIGSGNGCSGQVLVWDDMVGQSDIQSFQPKFLKKYGAPTPLSAVCAA